MERGSGGTDIGRRDWGRRGMAGLVQRAVAIQTQHWPPLRRPTDGPTPKSKGHLRTSLRPLPLPLPPLPMIPPAPLQSAHTYLRAPPASLGHVTQL